MKLALLGYGKMGREIVTLVKEAESDEITSISFRKGWEDFDEAGIKNSDVVIDFTSPEAVLSNAQRVLSLGKNMVIGTTGWYNRLDKVKKLVQDTNTGLIYGQNFSIGANIFFKLVAQASKLTSSLDEYDVYGFEIHHTGKKDSPSGTALKIAEQILNNSKTKKSLQTEKLDRAVKKDELHFASIRGGRNPGFHQVVFDNAADSITLTHQAHGRRGFAQGAIKAAEFIKGKTGLHNFDELFKN